MMSQLKEDVRVTDNLISLNKFDYVGTIRY